PPRGAIRRGRGVQPGVAPQPGQDIDPRRAALGEDQRPDDARQGVAAVDEAQVLAGAAPRLLAEQLHRQLPLGAGTPRPPRPGRQLRLAEVEPAGDRQEPAGFARLVEHGAEDDPVVGADGAGAVGAAGGVLMEGAGAPDVRPGAMDLGVIDGRDVVAVPDPPRGGGDQAGQVVGDAALVPAAVLGEGLEGLPGGGLLQGQDRLGDGVLLDVEDQGGDPLGEVAEAAATERAGEGGEQSLPMGPGERSFGHGASPGSGPVGACHYPAGSDQETPPSRRYGRSAGVPSYRETTA